MAGITDESHAPRLHARISTCETWSKYMLDWLRCSSSSGTIEFNPCMPSQFSNRHLEREVIEELVPLVDEEGCEPVASDGIDADLFLGNGQSIQGVREGKGFRGVGDDERGSVAP